MPGSEKVSGNPFLEASNEVEQYKPVEQYETINYYSYLNNIWAPVILDPVARKPRHELSLGGWQQEKETAFIYVYKTSLKQACSGCEHLKIAFVNQNRPL